MQIIRTSAKYKQEAERPSTGQVCGAHTEFLWDHLIKFYNNNNNNNKSKFENKTGRRKQECL